jgi:ribosomal protein S18 acetylase RimI-like enzyme
MNFTLATLQDAPQIAEAIALIFFPHPEILPGLAYRLALPPLQHFCLVAAHQEEIIGILEMVILGNICCIVNLGVLPAARGMGIASGMMAIAHLIADKIGVKQIYLAVLPDNIAARKLYLKFGYCELGEVVFNSSNVLLMRREVRSHE